MAEREVGETKSSSKKSWGKRLLRLGKIIIPTAVAGYVGGMLATEPLPLDERFVPPVRATIKATLIAFEPNFNLKNIQTKTDQITLRDASQWNIWFPRSIALNDGKYRAMGQVTSEGRFPSGPKIQLFDVPDIEISSHELLHLYPNLTLNHWISTKAFSTYASHASERWSNDKRNEDKLVLLNGLAIKLKRIEKNNEGWTATGAFKNHGVIVTRDKQGLSVSFNPPLTQDEDKHTLFTKRLRDRLPEINQYLVDFPYGRFFKLNHTNDEISRWASQHDKPDVPNEVTTVSERLCSHALRLESLFPKPGIGSTFIRLVSQGMPAKKAEFEAISGLHAERERAFVQQLMKARSLFEQVKY